MKCVLFCVEFAVCLIYICVCVCVYGTKLLPCTDMGVCVCVFVCTCMLSTSGSEIQIRVCLESSLLGYTRHSQRNKLPKAQSSFSVSVLFAARCADCSQFQDFLLLLI